nr:hypothetical protein GCM10020093_095370 [Planobispora longispora]
MGGSGTPDPAPSPAAAPVPLPTFFTGEIDPCTLISERQASDLRLDTTPSRGGSKRCNWKAIDGEPGSFAFTLQIEAFRLSSVKVAQENYTRFRKETAGRTTTGVGLP